MPRPDRHNEIEINLLTSGSLSYLLGGRRTTIEADRLAVFLGCHSTSDRGVRRRFSLFRCDAAFE